ELQLEAVLARGLQRVGEEDVEVAEAAAVGRFDRVGRVRRPDEARAKGDGERGGAGRLEELAPTEIAGFEQARGKAVMFAHGRGPDVGGWMISPPPTHFPCQAPQATGIALLTGPEQHDGRTACL